MFTVPETATVHHSSVYFFNEQKHSVTYNHILIIYNLIKE